MDTLGTKYYKNAYYFYDIEKGVWNTDKGVKAPSSVSSILGSPESQDYQVKEYKKDKYFFDPELYGIGSWVNIANQLPATRNELSNLGGNKGYKVTKPTMASTYAEATVTRKTGVTDLAYEMMMKNKNMGLLESISEAQKQKIQAKVTGIKEAFDPLAIVAKLTGSQVLTAAAGRALGRSDKDIRYFAEGKHVGFENEEPNRESASSISTKTSERDVLVKIYKLLSKFIEITIKNNDLKSDLEKAQKVEEAEKEFAHRKKASYVHEVKSKLEEPEKDSGLGIMGVAGAVAAGSIAARGAVALAATAAEITPVVLAVLAGLGLKWLVTWTLDNKETIQNSLKSFAKPLTNKLKEDIAQKDKVLEMRQEMYRENPKAFKKLPVEETYKRISGNLTELRKRYVYGNKMKEYEKAHTKEKMYSLVEEVAKEKGLDPLFMKTMMNIESGGDPNAVYHEPGKKPKAGAAKGLFQFIPGTAKEYGIYGDEFNPVANARAAAQLSIENKEFLESSNIEATPEMMYLAHQQGRYGARDLYRMAQKDVPFEQLPSDMQKRMASNFGKMSAKEYLEVNAKKFEQQKQRVIKEQNIKLPEVSLIKPEDTKDKLQNNSTPNTPEMDEAWNNYLKSAHYNTETKQMENTPESQKYLDEFTQLKRTAIKNTLNSSKSELTPVTEPKETDVKLSNAVNNASEKQTPVVQSSPTNIINNNQQISPQSSLSAMPLTVRNKDETIWNIITGNIKMV